MKNFKKSIKIYLIAIVIFVLVPISIIMYIDFFQIFHKTFFDSLNNKVHKDMRIQAAGMINNYNFDSIILGTSMLSNTSASEASDRLDKNFANISIHGSDYHERALILKYALAKKKIDTVIYSLDSHYLNQETKPTNNIYKLYDNNRLNDIDIYFSKDMIVDMFPFGSPRYLNKLVNIDSPTSWSEEEKFSKMFGGMDKWFSGDIDHPSAKELKRIVEAFDKSIQNRNNCKKKEQVDLAVEYINKYLLDIIRQYNHTRFILVFPPYSTLQNIIWNIDNTCKFEVHKEIIKYMVSESESINNMKIYGFSDQNFTKDIGNYFDLRHYRKEFNSVMLDEISKEKGLLTLKNLNQYMKKNQEMMEEINLGDIVQYIKNNYYDFKYGVSKSYVSESNFLMVRGWVLNYERIDEVILKIDNKQYITREFHNRGDIYDKYPQYAQKQVGFLYNNIQIAPQTKQVALEFKSKGKLIETKIIKIRE